jgi:hypothetical protein
MKTTAVEFGVDSAVFFAFSQLAVRTWISMDRVDDAKGLARQIYSNMREKLGYDHPLTLEAMISLSETLRSNEETLQAEELVQQALSLSRARQGTQHPAALQVQMLAYEVMINTGNHECAAQLAAHVYNVR